MKRRRAPLEIVPPRSSRLELIDADQRRERWPDAAPGFHPTDEDLSVGAPGFHLIIGPMDSQCLENSCNKLPRNGLLILRCEWCLEFDRRRV